MMQTRPHILFVFIYALGTRFLCVAVSMHTSHDVLFEGCNSSQDFCLNDSTLGKHTNAPTWPQAEASLRRFSACSCECKTSPGVLSTPSNRTLRYIRPIQHIRGLCDESGSQFDVEIGGIVGSGSNHVVLRGIVRPKHFDSTHAPLQPPPETTTGLSVAVRLQILSDHLRGKLKVRCTQCRGSGCPLACRPGSRQYWQEWASTEGLLPLAVLQGHDGVPRLHGAGLCVRCDDVKEKLTAVQVVTLGTPVAFASREDPPPLPAATPAVQLQQGLHRGHPGTSSSGGATRSPEASIERLPRQGRVVLQEWCQAAGTAEHSEHRALEAVARAAGMLEWMLERSTSVSLTDHVGAVTRISGGKVTEEVALLPEQFAFLPHRAQLMLVDFECLKWHGDSSSHGAARRHVAPRARRFAMGQAREPSYRDLNFSTWWEASAPQVRGRRVAPSGGTFASSVMGTKLRLRDVPWALATSMAQPMIGCSPQLVNIVDEIVRRHDLIVDAGLRQAPAPVKQITLGCIRHWAETMLLPAGSSRETNSVCS
ncbi:hypothetical protein CYMTET_38697 [Cymbomonas tetramitiformis]|uniref:Uncharacterized protein n=1 Tax=Cymbomonas tetramitiformis TaxID=36881 RepID=A0AAE0CCQ8_9CHLO|nr:hypothetical protein CYMTET_38697 [Cymbomonas tetramitiformis]